VALGQLVSRTVNGQTTWYLGQQATVTSVAGVLRADVHVAVEGQRVASVRVGGSPRTLYLHRDRLTSVVATTLAGGVRGATYRYGPHGLQEGATGDTGDAASELGYAGARRLTGGLLLMGARVYDPGARIFLQPDPLAPHDYTYAAGDPINKWDPTGLAPKKAPPYRCVADGCGPRAAPEPPPEDPVGFEWTETSETQVISQAPTLVESPGPGTLPVGSSGPGASSGPTFMPGEVSGGRGGATGDGGGVAGQPAIGGRSNFGGSASRPQFNYGKRFERNFWWSYNQTRSAEEWLLGASAPEAAYYLLWRYEPWDAARKLTLGLGYSNVVTGPAADRIGGRTSFTKAFQRGLIPGVGMDWGLAARTYGAGLVRGVGIGILIDAILMFTAGAGSAYNAWRWTSMEELEFTLRYGAP